MNTSQGVDQCNVFETLFSDTTFLDIMDKLISAGNETNETNEPYTDTFPEPHSGTRKKQLGESTELGGSTEKMYCLKKDSHGIPASDIFYGRVISTSPRVANKINGPGVSVLDAILEHKEYSDRIGGPVYYVTTERPGNWAEYFDSHIQSTGNSLIIYWAAEGVIIATAKCKKVLSLPLSDTTHGYPLHCLRTPDSPLYNPEFAAALPPSISSRWAYNKVTIAYLITDIQVTCNDGNIKNGAHVGNMDFVECCMGDRRNVTDVGYLDWIGPVSNMKRCGYINVIAGIKGGAGSFNDLPFKDLKDVFVEQITEYTTKDVPKTKTKKARLE